MKPEELERIIDKIGDDIFPDEQDEKSLASLRSSYSFSPGFTAGVIEAIAEGKRRMMVEGITYRINSMFLKIAVTGIAAVLLLAISVFWSGGDISFDALLGLGNMTDENLISLLTGN